MSAFASYFRQQFLLARVFGIPIQIDYRWLPVLLVSTAICASSINALAKDPLLSGVLALGASLIFFASILVHELAHALAAKRERLEVVEILLHPFGGMARFAHEPETAAAEFRIALAGPAASFVLSLLFAGLMAISSAAEMDILAVVFFLLALSNFLLGAFNLFPGYPLDGGRILRAYLWKQGKDLDDATVLTGRCGQSIAVGLIAVGALAVILRGEFFAGFWAVLVGFFLYESATGVIREVHAKQRAVVDDAMHLAVPVSPDLTLQKVIDNVLPLNRETVFPVVNAGQFYGMLLLSDAKAITPAELRRTLVSDVMRPLTHEQFVELGTALTDANAQMRESKLGALAVVNDKGRVVGMLRPAPVRKERRR